MPSYVSLHSLTGGVGREEVSGRRWGVVHVFRPISTVPGLWW